MVVILVHHHIKEAASFVPLDGKYVRVGALNMFSFKLNQIYFSPHVAWN